MWLLSLLGCIPTFPEPGDDTGGASGSSNVPGDADGDGVPLPQDCDDSDASVYPGAPESCGDEVDRDCDGERPGCLWSGDVPASLAVATVASTREGGMVYPGGHAWPGADGVAVGVGTSRRFTEFVAADTPPGNRAYVLAMVDGRSEVTTATFTGALAGQHSRAVSVGDVDGDSIDDILLSSYCYLDEMEPSGSVPASWTCGEAQGGSPDGSSVFLLTGGVSGGTIDLAVASEDLHALEGPVKSCPGNAAVGLDDGRWVISGFCESNYRGQLWVIDGVPTATDLDSASSAQVRGPSGTSGFGWTLATGDLVHGDGVADLLVGDFGDTWQNEAIGMSASVWDAAALDGILFPQDAERTWFSGKTPHLGLGTHVGAGDIDGDGTDDVVVGASGNWPGYGNELAEVFVLGADQADGNLADRAWMTITGTSFLGSAVSVADVDRDGLDDLILGEGVLAATGEEGGGGGWFIPGRSLTGGTAPVETVAAARFLSNREYGVFGIGVAVPGDVDGDGWNDVAFAYELSNDLSAAVFLGGPLP